jgi:hypothetical protein
MSRADLMREEREALVVEEAGVAVLGVGLVLGMGSNYIGDSHGAHEDFE